MKESFLIYKAFYEPIKDLSNEDMGQLFRSLFEYQISQIEPTNTSRIYMAFQFFKNQFRLDEAKYQGTVERNRNNGKNGGRPPKPKETEHNPKNPVGFQKPKKADNDNDNEKDKDIGIRLAPPKPKKIRFEDSEIFDKHKFAARFPEWPKAKLAHYYDSALSYSVEGNKYVNWGLAIQNWASRDDKQGKFKWNELGKSASELKPGEIYQPPINFY